MIAISNGLIMVEDSEGKSARSIFVNEAQHESVLASKSDADTHENTPSSEESKEAAFDATAAEQNVLGMSIDPSKVTIEGLNQYENLMKGRIAKATSNATYQSGSTVSMTNKQRSCVKQG